jgi:hypothetical protein
MSFFKKLFGKVEPQSPAPFTKANDQKTAITLLFSKLPRFESPQSVLWSQGNLLPLEIQVVTEGSESMAYATFGPHRFLLVGFSSPLPKQVQQQTIHLSNWPDQAKQAMYSHQAHLICFYESGSDDPNEQLLALYKVATTFKFQGLLGVTDEIAMTANPVEFVEELFMTLPLEALLSDQQLPYVAWVGVIKLIKPDGMVWWVSRGHQRFGVPDLAHLAPFGQGERVTEMFSSMLKYMYFYQARIEPGHTAELGQMQLKFDAPYEYQEYIQTPTNTALVMTITSDV